MSDPWKMFAVRSERSDCAGYFERAGTSSAREGSAVMFTEADDLLQLTRSSQLADWERQSARLLRGRADRALLGYVGFDAAGIFEPLLRKTPGGSPFPLCEFALVSGLKRVRVPPLRPRRRTKRFRGTTQPLADSLPRSSFGKSVRRLVEAIRAGEAYQVVLSHRREWETPEGLIDRATHLRESERYAFFYYLKFGDRVVVGASPESVLEVTRGRAVINPIAGTRPLGTEARRRLPLRADPKELAEHRMLVDLARNDLGHVSVPGSVRLVWRERRERFSRLEHLVSRVASRLLPEAGSWQTLGAAFPAGTVTGAPKIRATRLVREEERTWRGPYAGALGWVRGDGDAQWALAIRTAFAAGRRLFTAAGAGIVTRSEPAREWHETLIKLDQVEASIVHGVSP